MRNGAGYGTEDQCGSLPETDAPAMPSDVDETREEPMDVNGLVPPELTLRNSTDNGFAHLGQPETATLARRKHQSSIVTVIL
jgi:hypothetical protein